MLSLYFLSNVNHAQKYLKLDQKVKITKMYNVAIFGCTESFRPTIETSNNIY